MRKLAELTCKVAEWSLKVRGRVKGWACGTSKLAEQINRLEEREDDQNE